MASARVVCACYTVYVYIHILRPVGTSVFNSNVSCSLLFFLFFDEVKYSYILNPFLLYEHSLTV